MKTAALWNLVSCAVLHLVIGRPQQMGKSVVPGTGPAQQVWPPIPYSFQYEVQDAATGNYQNRAEIKTEDGTVRGSYSVLLPDGFIYLTTYNVTGTSGFVYNMVRSLANIPTHRAQARSSVNAGPVAASATTSIATGKQLNAADSIPEESKTISQQVAKVEASAVNSAGKSLSATKPASTSEASSSLPTELPFNSAAQTVSKSSIPSVSPVPESKQDGSSKSASEPKSVDEPKQDSTAKSLSEVLPVEESSVSLPFGSRL